MDEIRRKRLAKIEQQEEERKRILEMEQRQNVQLQKQAETQPVQTEKKQEQVLVKPAPNKICEQQTAGQTTNKAPVQSFEEWQNKVTFRVFQIPVNSESRNPNDAHDEGYELQAEDDEPLGLNDKLENIIWTRLCMSPSQLPAGSNGSRFGYLYTCWKYSAEIREKMENINMDPTIRKQRLDALDIMLDRLESYAGLSLQMPEMFSSEEDDVPPEQPEMLPLNISDYRLRTFVSRLMANPDNDVDKILGAPLEKQSQQVLRHSILDWSVVRQSLQVLKWFCEDAAIARKITTLSTFNPNVAASEVERKSLLGPFLRLSAYPDSDHGVAQKEFSQIQNSADLETRKKGLRDSVRLLQEDMFFITDSIVRSGKDARDSMLHYFTSTLLLNVKRSQLQFDHTTVASDGFMHNLSAVLLRLCKPFLKFDGSSVEKIDANYLKQKGYQAIIEDDTKINATKEQADKYYGATNTTGNTNFTTQIFFLAMASLHQGPISAITQFKKCVKDYNQLKETLDKLSKEPKHPENTFERRNQDFQLQRLQVGLQAELSKKTAYESMLMDPDHLSLMLQFYNLVMSWIIHIIQPTRNKRAVEIELPLSKDAPEPFIMLPEWMIEDIAEFYKFIGKVHTSEEEEFRIRYEIRKRVMDTEQPEELVNFIIMILSSQSYVKNPYLKAKLAEVLSYFTSPVVKGVPGELENAISTLSLAKKFTVPSLIRLYIDVQQTGASNQFYEKFNIRCNIGHILKTIWTSHHSHREEFRNMVTGEDTDTIAQFVYLLMSDIVYLLDEAMDKLRKIQEVQKKMDDKAGWEQLSQEARQDDERILSEAERIAPSSIYLGKEAVFMMKYMSKEMPEPFLDNGIVSSLAKDLDNIVMELVGSKSAQLNVKDRQKYNFNPPALLNHVIGIYLNLNSDKFAQAMAHDDRFYKKEHFSKAASILLKRNLINQDNAKALEKLVEKAERCLELDVAEEEDLGEPPEEFLDPIFFSLMKDPVLLPTSGVIVDRDTIKHHLMGDPRDPFNRKSLKMDMVVPATEMKAQIEQWKKEQRVKKEDRMDTSL